uniref:Uncharacterized protein n=1 Tax=Erwinia amylovora ATCC BAA-2158 TaxID=889211 RepID=E5B4R0_ERWAM|nr:hypothetical protein predicted by Glimmer/Critica [Erwinia amylovora ATCC BAA-2158]
MNFKNDDYEDDRLVYKCVTILFVNLKLCVSTFY